MTRTEAYMLLNSIPKVGPVRVRNLLQALGSVDAILSETESRLALIEGIGSSIARAIVKGREAWSPEEEFARMEKLGISVVDMEDEAYPSRLREIYDPPLVLYYKGKLESSRRRALAVVGSRQTTPYGFETTRKLAFQCAYAGFTVVSGLARGIDTAAHQGALAAKGHTVAVFGNSLDRVYPEENEALAEKIAEGPGALFSEFPLGTPPDKYTFPMRNRIVSGLSEGVLVVEAGKKSGAMITARVALDQGRQVFAVPGRIDNPQAKGCHDLIRNGAKLVESVEDIVGEFESLFPPQELETPRENAPKLPPEERAVLEVLGVDEMAFDQIIEKCGLPSSIVSISLLRLELKKLIRQLPGRLYIKTL